MTNRLFDFLNNDYYKLMIDMVKVSHSNEEEESIKNRFELINKDEFFTICKEHELDGVVGNYASRHGFYLNDRWKEAYEKQKENLDYMKEKAKEVCTIMASNNISMVILKNGGIMIDMIGDSVACPMEDIDSLVNKEDFYKAHDLLISNGFIFKFRSDYEAELLDKAFRDGSTEYYYELPNGSMMWFELAWRAVAGRWIRPDLEPNTYDLIERSYVSNGSLAHILSAEDNLLQVCIHTAKHSYVRAPGLRLHMDVDRIVHFKEIDWNKFLKKVIDTHVKTSTYFSLYIPSVLFGTPVPQWVLDALRPKNDRKILRMLTKAGLIHPHQEKMNKIQFLIFQTSLYDSFSDVLRVIYPNRQWMQERYNCKSTVELLKFTVARGLDLVGIRKKK